ncbi:hypothetical protein DL763_004264 [Monosporascus cannonballus]|nr:hypothetical protein DL763_004264 [Monosporascus cannonballus]
MPNGLSKQSSGCATLTPTDHAWAKCPEIARLQSDPPDTKARNLLALMADMGGSGGDVERIAPITTADKIFESRAGDKSAGQIKTNETQQQPDRSREEEGEEHEIVFLLQH